MKDLKSILQNLMQSKVPGFNEKMKDIAVLEAWTKAVGAKIAKNCWPVKMIDRETLLIASESTTWVQELKYLEKNILDLLEKELKERRVKKLKFKIGKR